MQNFKMPLIVSGAILLISLLISAWAWQQLPADAQIATHWNLEGEVDGYSSKFMGLLIMPLMIVFISAIFQFLPRIEPRKENLIRSLKAFSWIWIGTGLLLGVVHAAIVANAVGLPINIFFLAVSMTGILLVIVGNYMGKVRSNFFLGIRTPWTLSSELSWAKTHRLGGRLFVFLGIAMTAAAFWSTSTILYLVPLILMITVGLLVYSYFIWKSDPNKQALGR